MSFKIPTPHINAPAGAFADTVLMPGDPLRSKFIVENYLENAELVNNVRGVQGYTGFYKGKKVSVMASGMGCPSIGIYSYELFNFYDVKNIIRIAYTDSGYLSSFGFRGNAAPCCSYELLAKAVENAKDLPVHVECGPIFSSDAFYSETSQIDILSKLGVLAVEMEAAALYINAERAGKNALAMCSISDSLVTGEELPAEERQVGFRNMMELSLSLI